MDASAGSAFFKLKEVAFFASEIVNGMAFLHNNSIVHRDLKSENIFVSFDDQKKSMMLFFW